MIDFFLCFSFIMIVYAYLGYPVVLWLLGRLRYSPPRFTNGYLPTVTVLIAAHNEELCIGHTLRSILDSDYPENALDVVVVSDASTDRTDEIVSSFQSPLVNLLRLPLRGGKTRARAAGYDKVKGEIVVSADAGAIFSPDAIKKLTRHFNDPKTGSVVAAKHIMPSGTSVARGDGLYWKYESALRHLENKTGACWATCEGGHFAIRRNLLAFNFPKTIAEDYATCCRVFEQGYLNRYDPEAIVYEPASLNIKTEFRRKIRVIVRGIRAFFAYWRLLNPVKHPSFFFQNISHRFCRWLVPFFLIILFICGILSQHGLVRQFLYAQCGFYGIALLGWILKRFKLSHWIISIPLYFTTVNLAALLAWMAVFKKLDVWTPTGRETAQT